MPKKKSESVLEEIKENIEEGAEALEEVVEEIEENAKKEVKSVVDKVKKNVKKGEEIVEEAVEKISGKELEKAAEAESTTEEKSIEDKKKALMEKAKKLKEKVEKEGPSTEELKEQVKGQKKTDSLLLLDEYIKAGIYIGTKVVTPDMKQYVYRRRADGLAIFNTDIIDEKLKESIAYLSEFNPEDVIVVCKRAAGWKAVNKFSDLTGIRAFTKKYPAGILTNTSLPNFFENKLTIVCDSWVDKNALNDTLKVNKKVLMICDTNNFSKGTEQIIIGNNKSPKSLGLIFYLLTKGYCKNKGLETEKDIPELEWWTESEESQ